MRENPASAERSSGGRAKRKYLRYPWRWEGMSRSPHLLQGRALGSCMRMTELNLVLTHSPTSRSERNPRREGFGKVLGIGWAPAGPLTCPATGATPAEYRTQAESALC